MDEYDKYIEYELRIFFKKPTHIGYLNNLTF